MIAIWTAIREGSNAYLKRQFRTIAIIAIIISLVILAAFGATVNFTYGSEIALSFLLGVAFSLFAAYVALYSATNANVRSTAAAEKSTYEALKVATLGGGALGLVVISMSLLGLSVLYAIFRDPGILAGFGFGASLAALFAQLGGGIFTKSADVGADLVGKVEENFPEDDPRNPAAIADNVGDNVGDEAGRGADLFESLTAENLGGMIIGLIVSIILFQGDDAPDSQVLGHSGDIRWTCRRRIREEVQESNQADERWIARCVGNRRDPHVHCDMVRFRTIRPYPEWECSGSLCALRLYAIRTCRWSPNRRLH